MFKRREKQKLSLKIKSLIWPRMGWRRAMRYFNLRIVRLSATPEPLARAIACGVAVSFFPVFGVHAVLGIGAALAMRANAVAAALATLLMPPVILPFIFTLDFLVGREVLRWLGHEGAAQAPLPGAAVAHQAGHGFSYMIDKFDELFLPALVGSCIFMPLVWPACYMAAHRLIAALARRHRQLKEQAS